MSAEVSDVPKSSVTFRLIFPEAFFRMWRKASCSPCMSATKCSVPFGRFRMASRFIISVEAALMVGKLLANPVSQSNR